MTIFSFVKLIRIFKNYMKTDNKNYYEEPPVITKMDLPLNKNYTPEKYWGFRPKSMIDKIIVHQELGEGTTIQVHKYHTSKECHLKNGVGAPKIAYHYTIEKDGTIYKVNEDTDITWHCKGQNLSSLGIMLVGDFTGPTHKGKSVPTKEQKRSLFFLLRELMKINHIERRYIYGHSFFGKENCPGNIVEDMLVEFKDSVKV